MKTSYGIVLQKGELEFSQLAALYSHPQKRKRNELKRGSAQGRRYLIAQRRNTCDYIDFIYGRYRTDQLSRIFCFMTVSEKSQLLMNQHNFDALWMDLNRENIASYKNTRTYLSAKAAFDQNSKYIGQLSMIRKSGRLEWLFPRGRKKESESNIDCAKREFEEETTISQEFIRLKINSPITQIYSGTDGLIYRSVYYLFELIVPLFLVGKKTGYFSELRPRTLSDEINRIRWVTIEESKEYLHPGLYHILKSFSEK